MNYFCIGFRHHIKCITCISFLTHAATKIYIPGRPIFSFVVDERMLKKIWQEVQKRKQERERGGGSRKKKKGGGKNKKKLQKQAKRLSALSEVMTVDNGESNQQISPAKGAEVSAEKAPPVGEAADGGNDVEKKEEGGIVGKIKGFYERADSMAASQALLLNKELEDRGVVEKITDESGLRVIGREAAKLEEEKQATKEQKDDE